MTGPGHDLLARELLAAAEAAGLAIVTAESCTGGGVAAAITDIAGSSAVFDRGYVTYSNAAKVEMLGVRPETLAAHGAVSEPVAREMAEGALARSAAGLAGAGLAGAGLAVAVTGVAGPGGSEFKPEGRVCFALARSGAGTVAETAEFGALGRAGVRAASVERALRLLLAAAQAHRPGARESGG